MPLVLFETFYANVMTLGPSNHKNRSVEDEPGAQVDVEDPIGTSANNPVDLSEHDDAYLEEENYDDWEDAVEGDGDPDTTWEAEAGHETASNESSVTLSSKASKRSFDEVELEENEADGDSPPGSPGAKRTRVD
ncbi:hypothetical protein B0H10DRAFT_2030214 [Mycena sp. CBHHK59/15]|nr:hypothetical protein B0H10DRAFT_2030214 [Mycena sp. CBHHK59/15]